MGIWKDIDECDEAPCATGQSVEGGTGGKEELSFIRTSGKGQGAFLPCRLRSVHCQTKPI
jgi:hypothetical protein